MSRNQQPRQFHNNHNYYPTQPIPLFPFPFYDPNFNNAYPQYAQQNISFNQAQPSKYGEDLRNKFMLKDSATNSQSNNQSDQTQLSNAKKEAAQTDFIRLIRNIKEKPAHESQQDDSTTLEQSLAQNIKKLSSQTEQADSSEKFAKALQDAEPSKQIVEPSVSATAEEPTLIKQKSPLVIEKSSECDDKYTVGSCVDNRRHYSIIDFLTAKEFPDSVICPDIIKETGKYEPYMKVNRFRNEKITYVRGANAWVSNKERIKNLTSDEVSKQLAMFLIQSSINKFTRNNSEHIYKELAVDAHRTKNFLDYIIDCLFRAVTVNSSFIAEFAKLIERLSLFFDKDKDGTKRYFKLKCISRFTEGCKLSEECINDLNKIKARIINTLDECDDMNEELQILENIMRKKLIGCAQMIAHLCLQKTISDKEALTFLKSLKNLSDDLEVEMICSFLTIFTSKNSSDLTIKNEITSLMSDLNERKKRSPMRLRFMIDDLLESYNNVSKIEPKTKICVTNLSTKAKADSEFSSLGPKRGNVYDQSKSGDSKHPIPRRFGKSNQNAHKMRNDQTTGHHAVEVPVSEPPKAQTLLQFNSQTLIPMLNSFLSNFDIIRLIAELKDYTVTEHMEDFVTLCFEHVVDKGNVPFVFFGRLLHELFNSGRLSKVQFMSGFSEFMTNFSDSIIDVPTLPIVIAQCIVPVVLSNKITLDDYFAVLKTCNVYEIDECIFGLMNSILGMTNKQTMFQIWSTTLNSELKSQIDKKFNISLLSPTKDVLRVVDDEIDGFKLDMNYEFSFLESLQDANGTVYNDFIVDFCKIFFFCCPLGSEESLNSYCLRTFDDNNELLTVLLSDFDRKVNFFNHLNKIFKRHLCHPENLPKAIVTVLKQCQKIDGNELKEIIEKMNDKSFYSYTV